MTKFRRLLKKKGCREDSKIYQIAQLNNLLRSKKKSGSMGDLLNHPNPNLMRLLRMYESPFQGRLLEGLPSEREVNDEIEINEGVKPPHRPLSQFSPAELEVARD